MPRVFGPKKREHPPKPVGEGRRFLESYGIARPTSKTDRRRHFQRAFYSFFSSKEELLSGCVEAYEVRVPGQTFWRLAPRTATRPGWCAVCCPGLHRYRSSPLFKNFGPQDYDLLIRKLPAERVKYHLQDDDKFIVQIIAAWQAAGVQVKTDPNLVAGVTKALFYVSLHADEIGDAFKIPSIC